MHGDEEIIARLNKALAADDQDEVARIEAEVDRLDADRLVRLTAPDALTQAARWYAAHGIAVFPLRPGEKRPATAHGLHDATTDIHQINDWWADTPQANIGLPTGHMFDVIDIDPPEGWTGLATLKAARVVPPVVAYAHTPRGGMHLYIRPTGDGNTTAVAGQAGVDYRGLGGYVVGPPSRTSTGMWIWSTPINPDTLQGTP